MNDYSYGCTARYLAAAISENVKNIGKATSGLQATAPLPVANQR